jgi:hypothetical protein
VRVVAREYWDVAIDHDSGEVCSAFVARNLKR